MFNRIFKALTSYAGLGLLFFSTSCQLHRLDVQTQYFTAEDLASNHVGTPDPQLYHPSVGQRLLIQWSLTPAEMTDPEIFLYLKVRFRNHQEREIKKVICRRKGYYVFELKDEEYFETNGILTYYAEIATPSRVIACWKHPLWTNLITFDIKEDKKE